MYELVIKQKREYVYSDGRVGVTNDDLKLYSEDKEKLMALALSVLDFIKHETECTVRKIEEGQIYEE